jgi:hypothetical protein
VASGYRSSHSFLPKDSAWPWKLKTYLSSMFGFEVVFTNLAVRGMPSHFQAVFMFKKNIVHVAKADLILVDLSANDRPEDRDAVQFFKTGNNFVPRTVRAYDKYYRFAEGRLLMQLLLTHCRPSAAIMYIEVHSSSERLLPIIKTRTDIEKELSKYPCGDDRRTDNCSYTTSNKRNLNPCPQPVHTFTHWLPLVQLKVPLLAYSNVVCPLAGNGPDKFWPDLHPPGESHDFLAQLIAGSIFELSTPELPDYSSANGPVRDTTLRLQISDWNLYINGNMKAKYPYDMDEKAADCAIFSKSDYTAQKPKLFVPILQGSSWGFRADVAGKPGWICDVDMVTSKMSLNDGDGNIVALPAKLDASKFIPGPRDIVFTMRTNVHKPRISLQMLASYNPIMGKLSCAAYGEGTGDMASKVPFVFNTRWSDRTSQEIGFEMDLSFPDVYNVQNNVHQQDKTNVDASLTFIMLCRAHHGKVKITNLIGC